MCRKFSVSAWSSNVSSFYLGDKGLDRSILIVVFFLLWWKMKHGWFCIHSTDFFEKLRGSLELKSLTNDCPLDFLFLCVLEVELNSGLVILYSNFIYLIVFLGDWKLSSFSPLSLQSLCMSSKKHEESAYKISLHLKFHIGLQILASKLQKLFQIYIPQTWFKYF